MHVGDKHYLDLSYLTFYAFNGNTFLLGVAGEHDVDVECAMVRVDLAEPHVPHKVFVHQHTGGVWVEPREIEMDSSVRAWIARGCRRAMRRHRRRPTHP